jgi:hypothetical protein
MGADRGVVRGFGRLNPKCLVVGHSYAAVDGGVSGPPLAAAEKRYLLWKLPADVGLGGGSIFREQQ